MGLSPLDMIPPTQSLSHDVRLADFAAGPAQLLFQSPPDNVRSEEKTVVLDRESFPNFHRMNRPCQFA
jgi:hypothetical protein